MKKIVVIAGVTASGKTKMGVALAHRFNGEIISADSVAVYRELNIGSAKPSMEEREGIIHHLIDVTSIEEPYHVAQFQKDARAAIAAIHAKGKLPIIVGGTGLYINALVNDYRFEEEVPDVKDSFEGIDDDTLYQMLQERDSEAAQAVHPNNRKRIVRTLNMLQAGKTKIEIHENQKNVALFDACIFFLQTDRAVLYERINKRVDMMMAQGLESEVSCLLDHNPKLFELQALQAIGYREFEPFFKHEISAEVRDELIKRNTRRFAKRQITWFKHQTPSQWIDIQSDNAFETVSQSVAQFIQGPTES
ncbi:tRNA (adenosine(37)-N6)-dimethylallyltransferase MiaA [Erysipelothrix aquatica]|uniref:tRNA (adenosine(37)-N6)-dimethylallyltransferase MiaA n=1 Tax=Erysipelothrix aquatica TaxID=2683714 RepID=UPI00135A864C|nr:tRNA (adenosine(37)-N6)-dimethylallyltransferase MiaA [Erysipelothrix aquatica]